MSLPQTNERNLSRLHAVEDALTAGAEASPPFNLRNSSIFVAVFVGTAAAFVAVGFRGLTDSRRSLDAAKEKEEKAKVAQVDKVESV
jgi:hypothetical protein